MGTENFRMASLVRSLRRRYVNLMKLDFVGILKSKASVGVQEINPELKLGDE